MKAFLLLVLLLSGCALNMQDPQSDMKPGLAVPVLEPTTGAWVNDNTWGDQYRGPMPVSEGKAVQILKNSRFYGPPKVHSVNLFRSDARLPENADIRAHVTYGSGAVQNEFFCDWNQGAQFSLVANTITIEAVTYAPRASEAYLAATGQIFFGAMLAEGSVGNHEPLTYTEPARVIVAAQNFAFDVPDFAVGLRLFLLDNNNPAVPTGVLVDFLTGDPGGGFTLTEYDAQVFAGGRSVPLPGATSNIVITNGSGVDVLAVAQWVLGI